MEKRRGVWYYRILWCIAWIGFNVGLRNINAIVYKPFWRILLDAICVCILATVLSATIVIRIIVIVIFIFSIYYGDAIDTITGILIISIVVGTKIFQPRLPKARKRHNIQKRR